MNVMDKLLDVSIDRLTVVGYPKEKDLTKFHIWLMNQTWSEQTQIKDFNYKYSYKLLNNLGLIQIAENNTHVAPIRYEFNPKHMDAPMRMKICKEILSWISSKKLNRIDIAIDLGIDLKDYKIHDEKLRQSVEYYKKDKVLETYYIGSRQSDLHFRFYNKQTEHNKKEMELKRQYERQGDEYEPELIDFDLWRFEVEMKGDDAKLFLKETKRNPFEGIRVYKEGFDLSHLKITERAMVSYLLEKPQEINELGKEAKAKYRKIMSGCIDKTEEIDLKDVFEQKKSEISYQLNSLVEQYIEN